MKQTRFLTAEWRKLVMANYVVPPEILKPFIPAKTELDEWDGQVFVSLVGMMFYNTRVLNIKIPFHINFPEVNLRFYVRFKDNGQYRHGIVFIRESVPIPTISMMANMLFKEHYVTLPMKGIVEPERDKLHVGYRWKYKGHWNKFEVNAGMDKRPWEEGSEEEFMNKRLWGYTAAKPDVTREYYVSHPVWDMYRVLNYTIDVDYEKLYGPQFVMLKQMPPKSVYLAEGSGVSVFTQQTI